MSKGSKKLLAAALRMPRRSRAQLAEKLLESLDEPVLDHAIRRRNDDGKLSKQEKSRHSRLRRYFRIWQQKSRPLTIHEYLLFGARSR
jgi:hypothetical protein